MNTNAGFKPSRISILAFKLFKKEILLKVNLSTNLVIISTLKKGLSMTTQTLQICMPAFFLKFLSQKRQIELEHFSNTFLPLTLRDACHKRKCTPSRDLHSVIIRYCSITPPPIPCHNSSIVTSSATQCALLFPSFSVRNSVRASYPG